MAHRVGDASRSRPLHADRLETENPEEQSEKQDDNADDRPDKRWQDGDGEHDQQEADDDEGG